MGADCPGVREVSRQASLPCLGSLSTPPAAREAALAAASGAGGAGLNAAAAAYAAPVREPQHTAAQLAALDLLVQRSIAKPLNSRGRLAAVTWQRVT